jgi:hypothetical protein
VAKESPAQAAAEQCSVAVAIARSRDVLSMEAIVRRRMRFPRFAGRSLAAARCSPFQESGTYVLRSSVPGVASTAARVPPIREPVEGGRVTGACVVRDRCSRLSPLFPVGGFASGQELTEGLS